MELFWAFVGLGIMIFLVLAGWSLILRADSLNKPAFPYEKSKKKPRSK